MSDDFQPEKPYPSAKGTGDRASTIWVAVLSALGVVMVLALVTPQVVGESQLTWLITLGGGALVFIIALLIGFRKGKDRQPHLRDEDIQGTENRSG